MSVVFDISSPFFRNLIAQFFCPTPYISDCIYLIVLDVSRMLTTKNISIILRYKKSLEAYSDVQKNSESKTLSATPHSALCIVRLQCRDSVCARSQQDDSSSRTDVPWNTVFLFAQLHAKAGGIFFFWRPGRGAPIAAPPKRNYELYNKITIILWTLLQAGRPAGSIPDGVIGFFSLT